eukprot:10687006-Alexandrium_andersonii.AAC.1
MSASLVGSEMCIRDSLAANCEGLNMHSHAQATRIATCLEFKTLNPGLQVKEAWGLQTSPKSPYCRWQNMRRMRQGDTSQVCVTAGQSGMPPRSKFCEVEWSWGRAR